MTRWAALSANRPLLGDRFAAAIAVLHRAECLRDHPGEEPGVMSGSLRALAPRMPEPIRALLHERYEDIDPTQEITPLLDFMREAEVFHEFAHARDPFVVHLRGTWAMLAAWGQEEATCRCGLFHSAYTRDGFFFRYFDIRDDASRQALRDVVGAGAEAQIYNYCIGEAPWDEREYHSMGGHPAPPPAPGKFALGEPIDPAGYDVPSRVDPSITVHYTAQDIANMSVVFVADLIEQISTVSTYGDIYHELSPGVLWPGTGLPGMGFAFYSRMLKSAAPYLPNVPPVFNGENSRLRTAFLAGLHFHTELAVLQAARRSSIRATSSRRVISTGRACSATTGCPRMSRRSFSARRRN